MNAIRLNFYKSTGDWHFRFETNGFEIDGFVSREFLDDEVGDDASDDEKLAYLSQHEQAIGKAALVKARGAAERAVAERLPYVGVTTPALAKSIQVLRVKQRQMKE
jgi:hypothetical protein